LGLALEEPNDHDESLTVDGIEVRVDARAVVFAAESTVDFVDSVWGKGFKIRPSYGNC
jgi:Fe-S cluster assembly iron-binding protein IscA